MSDRVPAPFPALRTGKLGSVAREDTRLAAGQGGTQRGSGGSSHTERTKGRWKKPLRRAGRARGPVTELLPQDTGSTGKWKPAANKWCSQLVAWHRIQEEGSLIFSSMLLERSPRSPTSAEEEINGLGEAEPFIPLAAF